MNGYRFGGTAVLLCVIASPALAQTASQITPDSYAPPVMREGDGISLPDSGALLVPEGADDVSVTLAGVRVEGATIPSGVQAELEEALVGRRIPVARIYEAASRLEQRLAREGAVLSRVVVPAQDLDDGGTLRLVVVQGYISRIDTASLPLQIRTRVARVLAPLTGSRTATLGDIERRLLLAGDTPGTSLRSTLARGEKPGATVLVIEADYRPVTMSVSLDSGISDTLGGETYGLGAQFNSALGLGETVYLNANGTPTLDKETSFLEPTPRNRALAAGIVMPLGDDGLAVNIEATDARTTPVRQSAAVPGVTSRFRRGSLRLTYPVIRSRGSNLTVSGAFDIQEERLSIFDPIDLPLSLDRLRVLRAGADWQMRDESGGRLQLSARASVGIDGLGARSADDATAVLPLSRAGADAAFEKLAVDAEASQPVAEHLTLATMGSAQTSFGDPLVNSEQFGIANRQGISPLASGSLQGDAGYILRSEVRAPFAWQTGPGFVSLVPYGFVAAGGLRLENPTAFERRTTTAEAYGAGIRASFAADDQSPALSAGIEYGHGDADGRPGDDRVTVSLYFQI
ncbi:ShlB/FhaC/HecB family hemolysin secretion/activation protein [Stakelama saccharophila]|uniref:ShlB/FhaC/HecB family hemolysin secretion/activation protein n=1 Tax=Stakelama saccharophila TaxID=3075605 RepID=A0ABZ0BAA9_9SPHN|nr:ShlB/FhaC/HecB family hemolysin secretion/activation protein [Stakelama sp. W311]WNO54046.1 ShlB/FhaC/HecB family hemolysin secretion/activation protein [Stakelama sp. W311]